MSVGAPTRKPVKTMRTKRMSEGGGQREKERDDVCVGGTMHPDGVVKSAMVAQTRGERSREIWEKIAKPDYSVLLSPSFWAPSNFKKAPQNSA
jgi:hypothetical protein